MNSANTDIRVLICYSERLLRTALCSILAAEPGLRVVGDAGDGFEAVSKARGLRPDVALVDERLTGLDGIQVTERLRADSLAGPVRSVILTEQPEAMFDAVRAGARGFLLRSSDQDELVGAIRAIARGRRSSRRRSPAVSCGGSRTGCPTARPRPSSRSPSASTRCWSWSPTG